MSEAWVFRQKWDFAWLPRRLSNGGWGWLRMVRTFDLLHVDRGQWVPSTDDPRVAIPKVLSRHRIVD